MLLCGTALAMLIWKRKQENSPEEIDEENMEEDVYKRQVNHNMIVVDQLAEVQCFQIFVRMFFSHAGKAH